MPRGILYDNLAGRRSSPVAIAVSFIFRQSTSPVHAPPRFPLLEVSSFESECFELPLPYAVPQPRLVRAFSSTIPADS
jgi:hypothetical protein